MNTGITELFNLISRGNADKATVIELARQINRIVVSYGETKELKRIVTSGLECCVRACLKSETDRAADALRRQEEAVLQVRTILLHVKEQHAVVDKEDEFPIWVEDLLVRNCLKVMRDDKIASKQNKPTSAYRLVLIMAAYSSAIQTDSLRDKFYVLLRFLYRHIEPYRGDSFLGDRIFITERVGGIGRNRVHSD